MESAVILIAIFAVVIIVVGLVFRKRIRAVIKGPWSTSLEVEASNPSPRPGVQIEDAQSRHGGLTARDNTGRGAEVRKVAVDKDIQVSSTLPQEHDRPNALPPA